MPKNGEKAVFQPGARLRSWPYPVLCKIATATGRTPAVCRVQEARPEEVVVEEVDTTPEVQGTATTGSGVTGEIIYYPGEAVWKYGVIFPEGYEIWNKPKQFRTYDDAQWYIEKVVSPAKEQEPEDVSPPSLANWTYQGLIEDEKGNKWWVYKHDTRDSWSIWDPLDERPNKHFGSATSYRKFMFPSEYVTPEEQGTTTNGTTTTEDDTPFTPSGRPQRNGPQFMGMRVY